MSSSRRSFLKQSAVAGAALGFPAVVRAANLNSKVQVACIGSGGMGGGDLQHTISHPKAQYVALCDVDSERFAYADEAVPGLPHFKDFRVMLEKMGDKIDAVNVGTPDHTHAVASIEAMKRGKHVYCQKPLAQTVWESRQMRLWSEKKKVVTQMGNQIHSALEYRLGTRLLKEGAIGKIKEVYSWVGTTGNGRTLLLEPPPPGPVPANLDWNLWIGPAPMRDYAPDVYHPFAWRDWQDFGGGAMGDFGCHILDPVFTALELTAPLTIGAVNSGINRHIWPTSETISYVFPGTSRTVDPTLKVTWMDGGLKPNRKLAKMPDNIDLPGSGSLFIGEKGNMVLPHVGGPRLYPLENFKGFAYPKDVQALNHRHRWIDAILEGGRTSDGFDYAGPLSEATQLGNIATRVLHRKPYNPRRGKEVHREELPVLEWDPKNFRITNNPAANALLTRKYRAGWEITPA